MPTSLHSFANAVIDVHRHSQFPPLSHLSQITNSLSHQLLSHLSQIRIHCHTKYCHICHKYEFIVTTQLLSHLSQIRIHCHTTYCHTCHKYEFIVTPHCHTCHKYEFIVTPHIVTPVSNTNSLSHLSQIFLSHLISSHLWPVTKMNFVTSHISTHLSRSNYEFTVTTPQNVDFRPIPSILRHKAMSCDSRQKKCRS